MPLVLELDRAYTEAKNDPSFQKELSGYLTHYVGRPSPLVLRRALSEHLGGAKIYLKREELNHTGAHKINNCMGQILLAQRMGKTRIIAETGAGQHGVASATVTARFGLPCVRLYGRRRRGASEAQRLPHEPLGRGSASGDLGGRDPQGRHERGHARLGHQRGRHLLHDRHRRRPAPYPAMVRDFQAVIGNETREQIQELEGRLPDAVVACVGGGSNAIGMFHPFLADESVKIYGVEASGHGLETDKHAASLTGGRPGVLHGNKTYLLQDDDGQILDAHSISAGLDYPGIGPEHSFLHDIGRAQYLTCTDDEALQAFQLCAELEGIIPALESAHALAKLPQLAKEIGEGGVIVLCLSGRGDKDIFTVADALGRTI